MILCCFIIVNSFSQRVCKYQHLFFIIQLFFVFQFYRTNPARGACNRIRRLVFRKNRNRKHYLCVIVSGLRNNMNKHLLRGIIYTAVGLACCVWSYRLMTDEDALYRWIMIAGVIIFGIGFLTIIYSFIRKIERHSILEERREQQERK